MEITMKPPVATVEDAELSLYVFEAPVWYWPPELAERLPAFEDLFVTPPSANPEQPSELRRLRRHLERGPRVKALLTGQKGSGKSWVVHHLAEELLERFQVVTVSLTGPAGVISELESVEALLLLIAGEVARMLLEQQAARQGPVELEGDVERRLQSWAEALVASSALPPVPGRISEVSADLTAWFVKLGTKVRVDPELRKRIREGGRADDLAQMVSALLRALSGGGPPVLVVVDDSDKLGTAEAETILVDGALILAGLPCSMLLTFPFALNFRPRFAATVGRSNVFVLRNVPIVHREHPTELTEQGRAFFQDLTRRLLRLDMLEDGVLDQAALLSGGIISEYGRILREAVTQAAIVEAPRVRLRHLELGRSRFALDAERVVQSGLFRARLKYIRKEKELVEPADYELLTSGLVVEYVNQDTPIWYDVHPILQPVVDEWLRQEAAREPSEAR